MTVRVYAVVFAGGCVGGAARLGIDQSIDLDTWALDIVAINLVGSALLGALMGWFSTRRTPWWVAGLSSGVLGGFTTFSAMAAPHPDARLPAAVLLCATLVGATLSAWAGWRAAESIAVRLGASERVDDAETIEAEVEGFDDANFHDANCHDKGAAT